VGIPGKPIGLKVLMKRACRALPFGDTSGVGTDPDIPVGIFKENIYNVICQCVSGLRMRDSERLQPIDWCKSKDSFTRADPPVSRMILNNRMQIEFGPRVCAPRSRQCEFDSSEAAPVEALNLPMPSGHTDLACGRLEDGQHAQLGKTIG